MSLGGGEHSRDELAGAWAFLPGVVGSAPLTINVGTSACTYLRYNLETGAEVQVTAATNAAGKRTWKVESVGSHVAGCYVWNQGSYAWDGQERNLPVRFTVTAR